MARRIPLALVAFEWDCRVMGNRTCGAALLEGSTSPR